mmetsp:Transcript_95262/g.307503  ORF Transcript_95262/g.307503 Transcript_95262/m.307503 type:complete len:178 (-) Transcript_95262:70-603(-)
MERAPTLQQAAMKRTMTMVFKDVNTKPMGILVNLVQLAVLAWLLWVIWQSHSSECRSLVLVLKAFAAFYAWDLCAAIFVCFLGYRWGILYISAVAGVLAMLAFCSAVVVNVIDWRSACGPLLHPTAVGLLGYFVVADLCVKTSLTSEEDLKIMAARLGVAAREPEDCYVKQDAPGRV